MAHHHKYNLWSTNLLPEQWMQVYILDVGVYTYGNLIWCCTSCSKILKFHLYSGLLCIENILCLYYEVILLIYWKITFFFSSSALISTLDSGSEQLVEGTFSTLQKICEDIPEQLESDSTQHPLVHLIPKFIEFFKCSSPKIRLHSITCINQFILCRSSALLQNMGPFLEGLFFLSEDKVSHF